MRVKRAAMSIETFHKASLVHDDIEDDDPFRYGDETMHRRYGVPTAINVGDYLIGMGYRLASMSRSWEHGGDVGHRTCLTEAHTKLSEGQGAELLWRDAQDKRLGTTGCVENLRIEDLARFRGSARTAELAWQVRWTNMQAAEVVCTKSGGCIPNTERPQGLVSGWRQQAEGWSRRSWWPPYPAIGVGTGST